jgi:hypothetical protein
VPALQPDACQRRVPRRASTTEASPGGRAHSGSVYNWPVCGRKNNISAERIAVSFLSHVDATDVLFPHVLGTVPASAPAPDKIISGFPEYAVDLTHDQHRQLNRVAEEIVNSQSGPFPVSALVITGHADRDLRANNPARKPGETHADFEMRVSDSRARDARTILKARIRHLSKIGGSRPFIDDLLFDPSRIKIVAMGASDLLVQNPANESERQLNRRVEIFLVRTLPPPGPKVDDFEKRIHRALKILETQDFKIDSTGKRKIRAVCLLNKMLKADVVEVFVDGTSRNKQIGSQFVPGATANYGGNYDGSPRATPPAPPLPAAEFAKLLGTVSSTLRKPDWALTQPDDLVLAVLDTVMEKIYSGMLRVEQYLTLQVNGFTGLYDGDQARMRLNALYSQHFDDDNNIYNCFKGYTGGEDTHIL